MARVLVSDEERLGGREWGSGGVTGGQAGNARDAGGRGKGRPPSRATAGKSSKGETPETHNSSSALTLSLLRCTPFRRAVAVFARANLVAAGVDVPIDFTPEQVKQLATDAAAEGHVRLSKGSGGDESLPVIYPNLDAHEAGTRAWGGQSNLTPLQASAPGCGGHRERLFLIPKEVLVLRPWT